MSSNVEPEPASDDGRIKEDVGLDIFEESNLVKHARRELQDAGVQNDIYGDMLPNAVLELIQVFEKQRHSGMSAGMVISLFTQLAKFEPITPLTGDDLEWVNHGRPDATYSFEIHQNIRCGHVFKEVYSDGTEYVYDSEARIFRRPDGICFMTKDSRKTVEFPYTPVREYVDVKDDDND